MCSSPEILIHVDHNILSGTAHGREGTSEGKFEMCRVSEDKWDRLYLSDALVYLLLKILLIKSSSFGIFPQISASDIYLFSIDFPSTGVRGHFLPHKPPRVHFGEERTC